MAKKIKPAAQDTTFNMTLAVDTAVAAPEDAVLAGLLEELQQNDPTVGEAADEIIEAADELIEEISAQAADTVAALNIEVTDAETDSLLDDLGMGDAIEAAPEAADAGENDVLDDLLEDVAGEAARIDAKNELYADQDAPAAVGEGDAPQGETKGKATRKKKDAAPKEPKPPRISSVTHKPGDLLLAKLGAKADDYLIFDLDSVANETARIAFIERMNDRDAIADKVRDKCIMLVTWLASCKGASELNEVLRRTFTVLARDGQLVSGDKGNLQLDLLAKPYSMGTARSQASQVFMLMPELGLCAKTKGLLVPNPDSVMLQAINAQLGL